MVANTAYTSADAMACIGTPKITSSVFEQTQKTLENLFNLHALNDWLNGSSSLLPSVNTT